MGSAPVGRLESGRRRHHVSRRLEVGLEDGLVRVRVRVEVGVRVGVGVRVRVRVRGRA